METKEMPSNREQVKRLANGWPMVVALVLLLLGGIGLIIYSIAAGSATGQAIVPLLLAGVLMIPVCIILLTGLFTLQPNEARVLVLFGAYKGTVREPGLHWGNPFYTNGPQQWGAKLAAAKGRGDKSDPIRPSRNKISLRARTYNGTALKVNDKRGNPIEIAAVLVWRIQDTAQAMFDVDNYETYIQTQSESALRHLDRKSVV